MRIYFKDIKKVRYPYSMLLLIFSDDISKNNGFISFNSKEEVFDESNIKQFIFGEMKMNISDYEIMKRIDTIMESIPKCCMYGYDRNAATDGVKYLADYLVANKSMQYIEKKYSIKSSTIRAKIRSVITILKQHKKIFGNYICSNHRISANDELKQLTSKYEVSDNNENVTLITQITDNPRLINCFVRSGYGELISRIPDNQEDILKIRNMGIGTYNELVDALNKYDVNFNNLQKISTYKCSEKSSEITSVDGIEHRLDDSRILKIKVVTTKFYNIDLTNEQYTKLIGILKSGKAVKDVPITDDISITRYFGDDFVVLKNRKTKDVHVLNIDSILSKIDYIGN